MILIPAWGEAGDPSDDRQLDCMSHRGHCHPKFIDIIHSLIRLHMFSFITTSNIILGPFKGCDIPFYYGIL